MKKQIIEFNEREYNEKIKEINKVIEVVNKIFQYWLQMELHQQLKH